MQPIAESATANTFLQAASTEGVKDGISAEEKKRISSRGKRRMTSTCSARSCVFSTSTDGNFCRICHDSDVEEPLISPCQCTGSVGVVHRTCVERWLMSSNTDACELCRFHYLTQKTRRPFGEWLKTPGNLTERKHLLGDVVCFFVLCPLATVSAWLCIRGVKHYIKWEDKWEAAGLLFLTSFLLTIFLVWLGVSLRYHYRAFSEWQNTHFYVKVIGLCELDSTKRLGPDHSCLPDIECDDIFCEENELVNVVQDASQTRMIASTPIRIVTSPRRSSSQSRRLSGFSAGARRPLPDGSECCPTADSHRPAGAATCHGPALGVSAIRSYSMCTIKEQDDVEVTSDVQKESNMAAQVADQPLQKHVDTNMAARMV